jgi:Na+-transporting NADH:ubiquinone oxidoreductase subunit NqrB
MVFKDARDSQILVLSLFLILGITTRDWSLKYDLVAITIFTCLVTQLFLTILTKITANNSTSIFGIDTFLSLKSALITALGLCLLLRANDPITMAIASFFAIGSKFLFKIKGKHFFNPANFGIIFALIFTHSAWVSPGQWGADWWYLLLFIGLGGMILKQVGRWETSAIFFLSYASLETIRNIYLGWTYDVLLHNLMSGSLLLFTLFMLTDPRSIPNAKIGRICWAITIACLTFILQHQFYVTTAIFWALFIISPFTIFFDKMWISPRFNWLSQPKILTVGWANTNN